MSRRSNAVALLRLRRRIAAKRWRTSHPERAMPRCSVSGCEERDTTTIALTRMTRPGWVMQYWLPPNDHGDLRQAIAKSPTRPPPPQGSKMEVSLRTGAL
jgi:hypothetical protein